MMEAVATIPPFENFYAEHRDAIFGFLARRLGRPAAEDAFQETFLRALRAYDRLEHGRHLRAWVFTIAARVATDVHRTKSGDEVSLGDERASEDSRPAYLELEHLADELPPAERAAVVLRYGYDLPVLGDRRGARIVRGRGTTGGVVGDPAAAQEGRTRMKVSPELDRRFRDAAAEAGLLDVAYDMVDTPIGALFVAATDARPLPHLVRPRARARRREPRAHCRHARLALGATGRRDAPSARRVLREAADRVRAR